jgi:hypothetical protein
MRQVVESLTSRTIGWSRALTVKENLDANTKTQTRTHLHSHLHSQQRTTKSQAVPLLLLYTNLYL